MSMSQPKTMTLALDLVQKDDPTLTRKAARAVVVERWPGLKSRPRRAVMRGPEVPADPAAAPKGPAPKDLQDLVVELEKTREQNQVLRTMVADRDAKITALQGDVARLETELEQFVIEDGETGKGNPASAAGSHPSGGDPLAG